MKISFVWFNAIFFFLYVQVSSAQELHYDVYKGDNIIGLMKVQKFDDDSLSTRYKIETEVTFRILKEFKVESTFESIFQSGQLTYGKTLNLLNGKERESSRVIWDGEKYICEREEKQRVRSHPISYSVSKLYFEEPITQDSTFSERFTESCYIEKTENPHSYYLHLPDGKENLYTYKNGLCTEVKVDLFLTTIYFKLTDRRINTGTE